MARFVAVETGEIPQGGSKRVTLKGRPIAVFNQNGEFFALLDRCPHKGANLCKGARIGVTRSAAAGTYEYSRAGEMVCCPWHGWEFDLRTGQSYCDPGKTQVRSFKVTVADGASLADASLAEGPYVAETFPVSVENNYVLIDI